MTPRQIASLKDSLGEDEDASEIDGFEELSEENQEKVRQAVAQGHVADEDWRGVSSNSSIWLQIIEFLLMSVYIRTSR